MIEIRNHIIAKVSWNSSFDWKEKAVELQERLSVWSKIKMARNANNIFDKFCPAAQTWKIETLTIDLGKIDFNNLEFELTKQLDEQLNQKLTDLIINGNRDHLQIDIEENPIAHLQVLRYFLLHGLMPWNYQQQDGSINKLLATQLKHNRHGVTDLIREIGSTQLAVRKRIAWQANESNIKTIIQSLEPNNYEQIIDFSTELIEIKVGTNRIQGSHVDFKKNLWLFIFNYLLTERGTIFNKVAFMKSNVKQFANHYNVSYQAFLKVLEDAVQGLTLRNLIKHELITVINILVAEQQTPIRQIEHRKVEDINHWDQLKTYLLQPSLQSKEHQLSFNDLVVGLSRADQARFAALILGLKKRHNWAADLVSSLSDDALATIFSVFSSSRRTELLLNLDFLVQFNKVLEFPINRNGIWEIGLKFLQTKQHVGLNNSSFLTYYLTQLSTKTGLKKEQIAKRILSGHNSFPVKTISQLDSYLALNQSLQSSGSIKYTPTALRYLIQQLFATLVDSPVNHSKLAGLSSDLLKYIQQSPKLTLAVMVKYANKAQLKQVLAFVLDHTNSSLLLANAAPENARIFAVLQQWVAQLKKTKKGHDFAKWLNINLVQFELDALVFHPKLTSTKLVEFILGKLYHTVSANHLPQFEQFVYLLSKAQHHAFSNLDSLFPKNTKQLAFQQLMQFIAAKKSSKTIAEILAVGLRNKDFSLIDLQQHPRKEKILNYLLNDAEHLFDHLLKTYTNMLVKKRAKGNLGNAQKLMITLLWKHALAYQNHHGNNQVLQKQFKEAMHYHFNLNLAQTEDPLRTTMQKSQVISLENGDRISADELFLLLETCLKKNSNQTFRKEHTWKLSNLITMGLALDVALVKKIGVSLSMTTNRIALWSAAIPFDLFCFWLMDRQSHGANEAVKSLKIWFNVVTYLLAGKMPTAMLQQFWTLLWKILKADRFLAADLKKFVHDMLFQINTLKPLSTASIVTEIRNSNIQISPVLGNILALSLPHFLDSRTGMKSKLSSEKLAKAASKGLLYQLSKQLICTKQTPIWFGDMDKETQGQLLNELIINHPSQFFQVLKRENISTSQYIWLSENVNFKALINTIANLNTAQQNTLQMIAHFYFSLGSFSNHMVSAKEVQYLLFKKVINAWLSGNWRILSPENIWQELIWEISIAKNVVQSKLIGSFIQIKFKLPPALQITLAQIEEQQRQLKAPKKIVPQKGPEFFLKDGSELLKDSIYVQNAGLVLISHYIPMLFERLGIIDENKKFLPDLQLDAVHYLQFVATGLMQTDESDLALNKILCGIPLHQPIKNQIFMSEMQTELIEQLIVAMIGYWGAIGTSSVEGFRGNWLVRDGLLIEYEDKWELTIEKRAYDLLIHKSPFTFSIIKYPWMPKPLYVQWPY